MPRLTVYLLGSFQVLLDERPASGFDSDKVRALLAFLFIEAGRSHRRERLAALLWPESPHHSALMSLRGALANLRQVIGDHRAAPPYLLISRQSIQFNIASQAWCDAAAFSAMLDAAEQSQDAALVLDQAVALYRGDFLEGLSLGHNLAFEEWALLRREEYRCQVMEALRRLALHCDRGGDTGKTLAYAQRMTAVDDLDEQAWRLLMRSMALEGKRNAALAHYSVCRNILSRELGIEPDPETTRLYEDIRSGKMFVNASSSLPVQLNPSARHPVEDHQGEQRAARVAGEQALARRSYSEAELHLARALDLTPAENVAEHFDILALREKLHDLRGNRSDQAKMLEAMEILLASLADDRHLAEFYLRRANFYSETSDYPAAIGAAQAAIEYGKAAQDDALVAASCLQLGYAFMRQGDHLAAQEQLRRALALARRWNLGRIEADSLRYLGVTLTNQGNASQAIAAFQEAQALYDRLGDRQGAGRTLNNLGVTALGLGRHREAIEFCKRALFIHRDTGDRQGESLALHSMGRALLEQGECEPAKVYLEEALSLNRTMGDRQNQAWTLINLGRAGLLSGDYIQARRHLEDARRLFNDISSRYGESVAYLNLGYMAHEQGEFQLAINLLTQSLLIGRAIGDDQVENWVLTRLGVLYAGIGQRHLAMEYFQQALALSGQIGDRASECEVLANQALLYCCPEQAELSLRNSQQAVTLAQELNLRPLLSEALVRQAQVMSRWGKLKSAFAAWLQALAIRRTLNQPHLAIEPLAGLAGLALVEGNLAEAQAQVEEILHTLDQVAPDSVLYPGDVFLVCWQVLDAVHDRRTSQVLCTAVEFLLNRAACLDGDLRRAYLEDLPAHRLLLSLTSS